MIVIALVMIVAPCLRAAVAAPADPVSKAEPRILWEVKLPEAALGGVAVGEGLAYVVLVDGRVRAYELEGGKLRWSRKLKNPPRTGPAFAGRQVIVADTSRMLSAISAASGEIAWTTRLRAQSSSEIGAGTDTVVLGVGNMACAAFYAQDGSIAWRLEVLGDVIGPPWVGNKRVVIGTTGHKLYSVAKLTGELLCEATMAGEIVSAPGAESAAARNSLVCAGSHNMHFDALTSSLKGYWRAKVHGMVRAAPLVRPGAVFAGTDQGILYAFRKRGGAMIWRRGLGGPVMDRLTMLPGALVAGAGSAIYFLDPGTGRPRQEFLLTGRIQGVGEGEGSVVAVTSQRRLVAAGIRVAPVAPEPELPVLVSVVADPPRVSPIRGTTTMLTFTLRERVPLTVDVSDAHGRRVRLVTHRDAAEVGTYRFKWNGTDEKGKSLRPGVYRIRVVAGNEKASVGIEVTGRR